MKSRERVVRAINHDYPDRPPISHAILPSAILKHGKALQDILKDVQEDNIKAMYETFMTSRF